MLPLSELHNAFPFLSLIPAGIVFLIIVALALWTIVIKAFALWYAARNSQRGWFIVLLVVNSLGILEVVYLLAFRKDRKQLASNDITA